MKDSTWTGSQSSLRNSHKLILNLPEVGELPAVKTMMEIRSLLNSTILDAVTDEVRELDTKCESVVLSTMFDTFDSRLLPKLKRKVGGGSTIKHFNFGSDGVWTHLGKIVREVNTTHDTNNEDSVLLPLPTQADMEKLVETLCMTCVFDDRILVIFDGKDQALNTKADTLLMFTDNERFLDSYTCHDKQTLGEQIDRLQTTRGKTEEEKGDHEKWLEKDKKNLREKPEREKLEREGRKLDQERERDRHKLKRDKVERS